MYKDQLHQKIHFIIQLTLMAGLNFPNFSIHFFARKVEEIKRCPIHWL